MILGGAQENTLLTVDGLKKKPEYSVLLATGPALRPEGSLLEEADRRNIPVRQLRSLRRDLLPWHDGRAFLDVYRLLKNWQPDIVHTHSSKAGILGRVAAWMQDTPCVIHTIHGLPFHRYQSPVAFHAFAGLERMAARMTDRILVVCNAMKEQALDAGVGRPDKFRRVYSGMEIGPFLDGPEDREVRQFRKRFNFQEGDQVLAKIARLAPLKGHPYLFEVLPDLFQTFPDLHLLLVGDGERRHRYERLVRERGWTDRVHFTGMIPPERIPLVLHVVDLVVHASLREGLARVLPQSLLSSTPVVTFDVDGAPEVVRNGDTGWLVPAEDTGALGEALHEALANPEEANRRAHRGREYCRDRFPADRMVEDIHQIYRKCIDFTG